MDKKKLKLSISGNTKKTITNIEQAKSNPKNSVIINNNKNFQKKKFYKINSKAFILICLGSVLSFSAYAIILWSYKYLPAGYVASLRESSIIMATILALFFLKEKVSKLRITSACIFFIGVVFIYNS